MTIAVSDPAPRALPADVRVIAAVLGGLIAAAVLGALYVASGVPAVEAILHLRFLMDPVGLNASESPLAVELSRAAGLVAAGLSGGLLATAAARGERWAGPWMGTSTYFLTLFVASIIPWLTRAIDGTATWGDALGQSLIGAPFLMLLAAGALAPLFVACAAAGAVWAWSVRRLVGTGGPSVNTMLGGHADTWLALLCVVLGLGWLVLAPILGPLLGLGGFAD